MVGRKSVTTGLALAAILGAEPLAAQTRVPASGTAWDPAPHQGLHAERGGWVLMLHGDLTLYRADDGGTRGREQWGSLNWVMGSAERPAGAGTLRLRGMLSLEPLTVGDCGYPNLLQTGEVCDGGAIVDAQHPHDLFMELSADYARPLGRGVSADLYLAPVGEPALGPAAFMHRGSANGNPLAPINHHWLDATHISFGVATLGIERGIWRLEGSVFNGREPDEERYDFDFAPLTSFAGRLQLAPVRGLVAQVSRARLRNSHRHVVLLPPELECPPGVTGGLVPADGACHLIDQGDLFLDVERTTASVSYHRHGGGWPWSVTAAWGRNEEQGHGETDGVLVEGMLGLFGGSLFGRAERVEKTDHDLAIRPSLEQFLSGEQRVFHLAKLALGFARPFAAAGGVTASAGALASWSRIPSDLEQRYGEDWQAGAMVFLTLRPSAAH